MKQKWADGPISQLGVGVSGVPNLLIVVGPRSPWLLSYVMVSIKEQTYWLADLIKAMDERRIVEFEAKPEAEQALLTHVNKRASINARARRST